jgi:hypothetical protein
MLRLEMLPAAHGDCLWIEYGRGPDVHRVLIDGGPAHTYPALRERILHLPAGTRDFDLLVVTHIDADHIEGVVRLLQDAEALDCRFRRVWFNGRDQLNQVPDPAGRPLGALQGELLGLLIADYEERVGEDVHNAGLPDRLAALDRRAAGLPVVDLPGGCRLTLLSPDHERLLDLKDRWADELKKARVASGDERALRRKLEESRNLQPLGDELGGGGGEPLEGRFEMPDPEGRDLDADVADALGSGTAEPGGDAPFGSDGSKANGSSIALLLEYPADDPGVRLLLGADAWPSVLEASIDRLLGRPGARLELTGFKVPHHGSVANLTESLLARLRCRQFLVSTSGAVFRHPHARAMELLLASGGGGGRPCLQFNYLSPTTAAWSDPDDQKRRGYKSLHPKGISLVF